MLSLGMVRSLGQSKISCAVTTLFLFVAFSILLSAPGVAAGKKMALVIGNDAYEQVADLQKAVNDSRAIGDTLESQGFTVVRGENLSRRNMNQTIASFTSRLGQGDEAVFFFAGHGVEIAGQNFLLPTDIPAAQAGSEDFVKSESVAVAQVLDSIRRRGPRVSILILDACRDNPFPKQGTRSLGGTRGFVGMNAPKGTFIMYSAGVGQTALDRLSDNDPHPNSVFTRSLVPLLQEPNLPITRLTRQLRRNVEKLAQTVSHPQRPAYYDEITGDFFFRSTPTSVAPPKPDPIPKPKPTNASQDEARLAWEIIKDSKRVSDFEAFIDTFGGTFFAKLAANRIKYLGKDVAVVKPASPKPDTAGQPVPPKPAEVEALTLPATFWPVGPWPEGIVFDGQSFWVAESGHRQIAQLGPSNGQIISRTRVGRLPVDMAVNSAGQIYSLVYTDQLIWSQRAGRKGRRFARLKDYPEGLTNDDETLWALVLPEGSSASSKVVRLDQKTSDAIGSSILGRNASGIVLAGNSIWVSHGLGPDGGQVTQLNPRTLDVTQVHTTADSLSNIAANSSGVFAAGGVWDQSGVVIKLDQQTGQQLARTVLPGQFSYSIAATENHVIVAGYQGRIWVLDASDLTLRRQIDIDAGPFQPRTILPTSDRLLITTQRGQGDDGSVVVIQNWQP